MTGQLHGYWFRRYLSDYFNINVVILYHNLLVTFSPIQYRTSLICHYSKDGLQIAHQNNGKCFFDYNLVKVLMASGMVSLTHLEATSKYKLLQLQQIATALEIPTHRERFEG